MKEFCETVWKMMIESNILSLLSALVILITGWLVALIVASHLRKFLEKTSIDAKLGGCLSGGDPAKSCPFSRFAGRFVYYLILVIAVLSALTAVNLTQTAEPIKNFANAVAGYAANILGAAALGFIAWIVASILRFGTVGALKVIDSANLTPFVGKDAPSKIVPALGRVVYWVVLLFFLPAILRALRIQGITEPLQAMFTKVLEYLPNLLAALLILFFGFLAAKIVRNAVTGLFLVTRLDELGEKAGVSKVFGGGISAMAGVVVYALVAIPVIISSLTALKIDSLSKSVALFFDKILNATGDILGAGLLIFVSVIAGSFVGGLMTQILMNFGFDKLLANLGFAPKNPEKAVQGSTVAGKITFIAIIFMAVISACDMLHFERLSELLKSFLVFGGNLILALIVLMVGIFLANLAADSIRGKGNHSELLATAVRVVVIIFTAAIALHNMNIGSPIVQTAFALILGSICIAAALAFGLGGREFASRKLEEWNDKFKK